MDENNKLIADFMGMKYADERSFNDGEWTHSIKSLNRFRMNWNWLIPVVDLIKERQIFGSQHLIDKIDNVLTCDCTLENLYFAVIEFIKFYNNGK